MTNFIIYGEIDVMDYFDITRKSAFKKDEATETSRPNYSKVGARIDAIMKNLPSKSVAEQCAEQTAQIEKDWKELNECRCRKIEKD